MNNLVPWSFKNYFVKVADTHRYSTRAAGGLFRQYARTNYRKFAIGNLERHTYCYTSTKNITPIYFILEGFYKQKSSRFACHFINNSLIQKFIIILYVCIIIIN